jgi:iron complex transport system substrate-binding protein
MMHLPEITAPPRRVISLVPSMTESLFDLGLGDRLVGATDYCLYPGGAVDHLPRVGGPKDPRIEDIMALHPDLVIINQEENTEEIAEKIQQAGIAVWSTFPLTVRDAVQDLWSIVEIFRDDAPAVKLQTLNKMLDWTTLAASEQTPVRYFCPIWQDHTSSGILWFMTFNANTYPHDLLLRLGGENIFAARERRYPLEAELGQGQPEEPGTRDVRYPRVRLEEIIEKKPECILLPDEPFAYNEKYIGIFRESLSKTHIADIRIELIEGSLLFWPGTRLMRALSELSGLFVETEQ